MQIDFVDDLGQDAQRRFIEAKSAQEHLKSAPLALVTEIAPSISRETSPGSGRRA